MTFNPAPKPVRVWCPLFLEWIRGQPCILAEHPGHRCIGGVEACHFPSRGSGGDDRSVYPGCRAAHDEEHHGAESFQKKYAIDLRARCAEYWNRWTSGDNPDKELPF